MINNNLEDAKQFALQNGAPKIIKRLMQESGCSVQDLADVLGIKPQYLSTKFYRNRFTFLEFQMITYLLEAEIAAFAKNGTRVN